MVMQGPDAQARLLEVQHTFDPLRPVARTAPAGAGLCFSGRPRPAGAEHLFWTVFGFPGRGFFFLIWPSHWLKNGGFQGIDSRRKFAIFFI